MQLSVYASVFVCESFLVYLIMLLGQVNIRSYFSFYFQLAACSSLCYLVQDMNSSEQDLLELLPLCWPLCFKLMEDVQEFDSKVLIFFSEISIYFKEKANFFVFLLQVQVLNLISILIEHVGEKVTPYANQLCQFFYKVLGYLLKY